MRERIYGILSDSLTGGMILSESFCLQTLLSSSSCPLSIFPSDKKGEHPQTALCPHFSICAVPSSPLISCYLTLFLLLRFLSFLLFYLLYLSLFFFCKDSVKITSVPDDSTLLPTLSLYCNRKERGKKHLKRKQVIPHK